MMNQRLNIHSMVRARANKNTEAFNTTQADAGKSYLKGGTLPTVDDLLRQPPVVGEVKIAMAM